MIDIRFQIDDSEKSAISAFAYSTGKLIEKLIFEETNNLADKNRLLEAKILHYRMKLPEKSRTQYDSFFGITKQIEGRE